MKYIVDRIEGDIAFCEAEDQSMVDIPLSELPEGVKEGDHLVVANEMYKIVTVDPERKKRLKGLMDDLWN